MINRIAGVFAHRGYNIESLAVILQQFVEQLNKLVNVLKVEDLSKEPQVERELMLVKLNADSNTKGEINWLVDIFRGNAVDISANTLSLEVNGDHGKMAAVLRNLSKFGMKELARTGNEIGSCCGLLMLVFVEILARNWFHGTRWLIVLLKAGKKEIAHELFDKVPERNITGCLKLGNPGNVLEGALGRLLAAAPQQQNQGKLINVCHSCSCRSKPRGILGRVEMIPRMIDNLSIIFSRGTTNPAHVGSTVSSNSSKAITDSPIHKWGVKISGVSQSKKDITTVGGGDLEWWCAQREEVEVPTIILRCLDHMELKDIARPVAFIAKLCIPQALNSPCLREILQ
ncbi:hypothetical protein OROMI_018564 [Orobanche minor]